jgi:hypothetical protein
VRQLIHVNLASEVIGGRRETSIRALPQRRFGLVKYDFLIWQIVPMLNTR